MTADFAYPDALEFFQRHLDRLVAGRPSAALRAALAKLATRLRDRVAQAGGMAIPYYRRAASAPST